MTTKIFKIDDIFDKPDTIPIYFDLQSYRQFIDWIEDTTTLNNKMTRFMNHLQINSQPMLIFKEQLAFFSASRQKQLAEFLLPLRINYALENSLPDRMLTSEIEKIYFHDEERDNAREHAKFLALCRYASASDRLCIITAHPSFKRVVDVDVYILPNQTGSVTLPANFDLFTDMELHPRLRDKGNIREHYRNGHYNVVVFEAVQQLINYIQEVTKSSNGEITLMNDVLDFSKSKGTMPVLQLSKHSTESEQNEQKGYYNFFAGVVRAIRNPAAHTNADDPFITSRFNDAKTISKLLCFMSLLFEKIDQRVSP